MFCSNSGQGASRPPGFPHSSVGKESTYNFPDWIPGSGRSPGEGIGYLLQYVWASLLAQMVKNLPVMRETWVRSLGWEDPLRSVWQPAPVFLPGKSPWTEEAIVHGVAKSWTLLSTAQQ